MVIEFYRCVAHCDATPASDIVAIVVLQGGSNFLSRFGALRDLASLFGVLLGLATAVFGVIGVLLCYGRNTLCSGAAPIHERRRLFGDERQAGAEELPGDIAEVTIRLEGRHLWPLRRHRCIVTVRSAFGGAQKSGQEVWLAKGAKSHR